MLWFYEIVLSQGYPISLENNQKQKPISTAITHLPGSRDVDIECPPCHHAHCFQIHRCHRKWVEINPFPTRSTVAVHGTEQPAPEEGTVEEEQWADAYAHQTTLLMNIYVFYYWLSQYNNHKMIHCSERRLPLLAFSLNDSPAVFRVYFASLYILDSTF